MSDDCSPWSSTRRRIERMTVSVLIGTRESAVSARSLLRCTLAPEGNGCCLVRGDRCSMRDTLAVEGAGIGITNDTGGVLVGT